MREPAIPQPPYWKIALFLCLISLFAFFTYKVYTSGTELREGQYLDAKAGRGKMLFQQNNCTACHQVYGLGGYLGPDLTDFMSRPGKGENYAKAILEGGIGIMPAFHLNEEDKNCLIAWLRYLDQSGDFPDTHAVISFTGTVTPKESNDEKH